MDDDLPTLAAALAYYSALSIAPMAVITMVIISYVPSSIDEITAQIQLVFGSPAADIAKRLFAQSTNPSTRSWAGLISILISVLFASAMFAQLQVSLNRIFEVKSRPIRIWFLKRIQSMGLVFVLILFLFLGSLAIQVLQKWQSGFFVSHIHQNFRLILMMTSPILVLKMLPEKKVSWIGALLGGISTGILFEIGSRLLVKYLQVSAVASTYGAMGTLLAFLLWIYYSALILLFGAEICFYVGTRRLR